MEIKAALKMLIERQSLSRDEMSECMHLILQGALTPAQIGSFLTSLRMKGESVDEIVGAAEVMRSLSLKVDVRHPYLLDTCGTGGDEASTFNISTASAFVAAAAGAKVAKHGNRSVSSQCGSADILEMSGVFLGLNAEQVARCIDSVGVGFIFAPQHHQAMKQVAAPRQELGVRTIFNLLGPLTNPANARKQVLGVYSPTWVPIIAEVLLQLGTERALVVHGNGLDEVTIDGETVVSEVKDGEVVSYQVSPATLGVMGHSLDVIRVYSREDSLSMFKLALGEVKGKIHPAQDILALNAGAAIYVAGLVDQWKRGIDFAYDLIYSGLAYQKLQELIEFTRFCKMSLEDESK
jgi:anthranilate phosphoribosyltransferase